MASLIASTSLLTRLTTVPARYPFYFGVGLSCVKTSFSDYLVQRVVERKEQIDWRRNAAFATFGFFYLGGVQYALYVKLFSRMFPTAGTFAIKPIREKLKDTKGMFNVAIQVGFKHPLPTSLLNNLWNQALFLMTNVHHILSYSSTHRSYLINVSIIRYSTFQPFIAPKNSS